MKSLPTSMRTGALSLFFVLFVCSAFAVDGVTTLTAPDGSTIVIYRDNYGVPHIRAANESALFFGQGYAAAEDRLFQMETFRRAALGRDCSQKHFRVRDRRKKLAGARFPP